MKRIIIKIAENLAEWIDVEKIRQVIIIVSELTYL